MQSDSQVNVLRVHLDFGDLMGAEVREYLNEYGADSDFKNELNIYEDGDIEYGVPPVYTFLSFPGSRIAYADSSKLEDIFSRMESCRFVGVPDDDAGECELEITYREFGGK